MFYDALTTAAVCDELRQMILGGFVQRVLRLSEHSLGLEVYANHQRHWLLISAHPQNARVHLAPEKLARASEDVTPLLLLLRKHVRDGRIVAVDQPPFERVIALAVSKRREDSEGAPGQPKQCKVIIEIMGRYSNVILTDEQGIVLDSLKRVPAQVNRYRVVLPQHPYVPPPPQQKTAPDRLDRASIDHGLRLLAPDTLLWQALVSLVAGMSPLLAREIVFRVTGDLAVTVAALYRDDLGIASEGDDALPNVPAAEPAGIGAGAPMASRPAPDLATLLRVVQAMFRSSIEHSWQPSIIRSEGVVAAFAPYLLTHLGPAEACPSISEAIDAYYTELERLSASEQQKELLRARIDEARQRHLRRKEALRRSMEQGREAERLRRQGEAILAALGSIAPRQLELEVAGEKVRLDPDLSPVDNAQSYFREYKKAKAALQQVPELLAEEETALAYFDEVIAHLELAATAEEVRRIVADLPGQAKQPKPSYQKQAKQVKGRRAARTARQALRAGPPPYRVLPGGYEVYVGRSAHQNEEVTFQVAGPEDLWLHARGVPGAHVVVKAAGSEAPDDVILAAARLAAAYSQARGSARVAVDVTRRKHVRRARAGFPGLVNYTDERTVQVSPEPTP